MSDIDKRLDEILADRMWFIEQELNVGQNVQDVLHNAKDELQDKIKQLMVDEFEKLIDDAEREGEVFWGNGQDKLRQKLEELKK